MKIGIMQPYFFPYIGYFQLIDAVDVYVNLEHVNFMKRSYMVRNELKNHTPINIPVSNASQNRTCVEVMSLGDEKWFKKFEKTLELLYKKESNYQLVVNGVILPWKNYVLSRKSSTSISEFNFSSILHVCKYLDLEKKFYSSVGITSRKKNEGIQDIVKHFGGKLYINAIGGQKLYCKNDFESKKINLKFIKMGNVNFDNPYTSILDLLFRFDRDHIKTELSNYTLI